MANETIKFKEAQVRSGRQAIDLQNAIRRCAVFAGIQDFDFADTIDEGFANLDDWTVDGSATWDVSGSTLDATGGGGGQWYQARHDTSVTPSFVASFDFVSGDGGAFVFRGCSTDDKALIAYWDGSNCGFAYVSAAGAKTALQTMPYGITGPARMQVVVKFVLDSVDAARKWVTAALWVDGDCQADLSLEISGASYNWTGNEIGFGVYNSDNCVFDNLTIAELCRVVDYTSIDAGETPGTGLSRAVAATRLKYLARYDGTMRVWRPGNRSSDWTVPAARPVRFTARDNRTMGALTHVRTLGALHEVDQFSDSEGDIHLHRFGVHSDPNLMSEEEVQTEAANVLNDAKEAQKTAQIVMPPNPALEPFDRVEYDSTDYRIVSIDTSLSVTRDGGPRVQGTLTVREYYAV